MSMLYKTTSLGIYLLPQQFIMKPFKLEKLKELHGEHPYTHHLDSRINILLGLLYLPSAHPFGDPLI